MIAETNMQPEIISEKFDIVRKRSEELCKPLLTEDYSVQPVVFVSPPKWHLAHTTWFYEQFVLVPYLQDYQVFDEDYAYLFNSYYNNAGERVLRPNRGLMTRPTVEEVYRYRAYVSENILKLLNLNLNEPILSLVEIGINHEEQHQELLAYDIKYIMGHQPGFPSFDTGVKTKPEVGKLNFISIDEGIYAIGHREDSFCYDNELGVHKVYLQPYEISSRLITNAEYIEFIESGGYEDFNLWHADGWDWIKEHNISAPSYWHKVKDQWYSYDFQGLNAVNPDLPVMHVSYYEAFAFAEWKEMRLPTEFEWEAASDQFRWGQLWEWTGSAYLPYPGFQKAPGALGEYNGKFMVNQHVLRGGSVATPKGHSRNTYRNFFQPDMRWMFSGIRLVK